MTGEEFLVWAHDISVALILIGVVLVLIRLIRGPSLPDRVIALDAMTVAIIAFCGVKAIDTGDTAFIDVAIVLALIGFLATVALARFAERRKARYEGEEEAP